MQESEILRALRLDGTLQKAVERRFLMLLREIQRHYSFAQSANPTDIFKPNQFAIGNQKEAADYFFSSYETFHRKCGDEQLHDLWQWFSDCFEDDEFLEGWEADQPIVKFEIEHIYAKKLTALPPGHVISEFVLDSGVPEANPYMPDDNPLTSFFALFSELFDARGHGGILIDLDELTDFYERERD